MIEATVNEGEVYCKIEGSGTQILSEIVTLANAILDEMVKDGDMEKVELVNLFCGGLNYIK